MNHLILLNCQNDFTKKGYSLFYSDDVICTRRSIINLIKSGVYSNIIPILDIHKKEDGNQIRHCELGSEGAKVFAPLMGMLKKYPYCERGFLKNEKRPIHLNSKFEKYIDPFSKNTFDICGFVHYDYEMSELLEHIQSKNIKCNIIRDSVSNLRRFHV